MDWLICLNCSEYAMVNQFQLSVEGEFVIFACDIFESVCNHSQGIGICALSDVSCTGVGEVLGHLSYKVRAKVSARWQTRLSRASCLAGNVAYIAARQTRHKTILRGINTRVKQI